MFSTIGLRNNQPAVKANDPAKGSLSTTEGSVEQSADEASALVAAHAGGASEAGTVDVQGRPWWRFVDEQSGEVALVRERPLASILVTGSAPEPTLVGVAAGLTGG